MARVPLRDVPLQPLFRGAVRSTGSFYVYYPTTTAAAGVQATVYGDSSTTTTLTQPLSYSDGVTQQGWVEAGEYTLSANSYLQNIDASAGDGASADVSPGPFLTPATAAQNYPFHQINSMSATTTSQLAKFVKLVPNAKITAAKIASAAGTAIATITGSFVGLYTSDGTTLTRVAVNATNTSSGLWDANNTAYRQALSPATNVIYPGQTYYVGMLVNATTPGTHAGVVKVANMPAMTSTELGDPPMYTLAAQTSLPTTQLISGLTAAYDLVPWVAATQ